VYGLIWSYINFKLIGWFTEYMLETQWYLSALFCD